MTIAVCLQTIESIAFATDSALTASNANGIIAVYNTTPKIFNLHKGSAIGAMSWGTHSFGDTILNVIMKEFRDHLTNNTIPNANIDISNFTIQEVANAFADYLFNRHIQGRTIPDNTVTGFIIAGISSSNGEKQIFEIIFIEAKPPIITDKSNESLLWAGDGESLTRLVNGYSPLLGSILGQEGLNQAQINNILFNMKSLSQAIIDPYMPIQEVIDLSAFLVNTASGYSRFTPGASTIGGPLEIATMTKHEQFKWIERKHYFSNELNS